MISKYATLFTLARSKFASRVEGIKHHHCRVSVWIQGAIGIVHLPPGQGQLDGGWHLVFWQSETEWDRSLAIKFCPYCGDKLELPERESRYRCLLKLIDDWFEWALVNTAIYRK